jgi:heptosyltransferase-2
MPNWVGDAVMAWPLLDALARSGRHVVTLAKPHLEPLLRLSAAVRETVPRSEAAETLERLRAARCDEAVILPNSFRSAWLAYQAGIPKRWGYAGDLRSLFLRPSVPRPPGKRPQIEDYRELLDAMGVIAPTSWIPRLDLPAELRHDGRARLRRGGIEPERGEIVGVFPGAEFGPSKRWPWRRFADLLRELRRQRSGLQGVIVAGPKELWTAVRVHEESGKVHPVIGPDLDLAGLAAVLSHFELLVTNDSGPMHLAAALGVRCVALFGPTDPRRTAPAGSGHRVLYRDLWCSPCFRKRCPLLHHSCLRGIGVTEVLERSLAGLEGLPRGERSG